MEGDDDLATKYSEGNFLQLVTCLEKAAGAATIINQRNQLFYVEVLRMLAEFVVYSEKYRKKIPVNYFEKLRERGMFDTLGRLLEKNNRFLNM